VVATIAMTAALAAFPPVAGAEPATLVDDSVAHFALGSPDTNTWVVDTGAVQLKRTTLNETFDAASLPSSLTSEPWANGPAAPTIDGGALKVDGGRVHTPATGPGPLVVEFRATFAAQPFQNVGLGNTLNEVPWAIFSTGGGSLPTGLYARTNAAGISPVNDLLPTSIDPLVPHTYRIEWSPTDVKFFVDDALVATHLVAITDSMRPIVSDVVTPGEDVKVDWLGVGPHRDAGTYESRVHDAGDDRAVWDSVVATESAGIALATRSGKTATPDGTWSAWAPAGSAGAIASPIGRYVQYRAGLTRHTSGGTPALGRVEISYDIDATAPTVSIDPVQAPGGTATVTFSSNDDAAGYMCRLDKHGDASDDGTAFAPCASGDTHSGLTTGTYTIHVKATDPAGNASTETRTFDVDVAAPSVSINEPDIDGGDATITFTSNETATFECSLDTPSGNGAFVPCTSGHAYPNLTTGSYTIHVNATDAAGNTATESRDFTVDVDGPTATIQSVTVNGNTATVAFTSNEAGARFECRLGDVGDYAPCPAGGVFPGLANGSYTVFVRAIDQAGNTGDADEETFVIAQTSGGGTTGGGGTAGGGGTTGGGGTATDTTAPNLAFLTKSVRASRKGDVKLRVKCPADEVRCVVTVALKQGRKTVGSKSVTVLGGKDGSAKLRLANAAKRKLAAAGKLNLKAVVTARDHVGNATKTTYALKVKS
jgi:hypothetical protein